MAREPITTQAIGEEEPITTTHAEGEEDPTFTTTAIGEEDGGTNSLTDSAFGGF